LGLSDRNLVEKLPFIHFPFYVEFASVVWNERCGVRYLLCLLQCIPNHYVQWAPPKFQPNYANTKHVC